MAPSFEMLMVARFLDGLPHGAYFGVASLVAASLAAARSSGPRRGDGDARALGRQRRRRARRHLAGSAPRLALGVLGRGRALACVTVALVLAFVPSCPGDRDATGRRELRAFTQPQVLADPARRRDRLRRHVRGLLLHRPDRHRGRRPAGRGGPGVPAGVRRRHGGRHLAWPGELADWSVLRSCSWVLARHGAGPARVLGSWRRTAGWLLPVAFADHVRSARCSW